MLSALKKEFVKLNTRDRLHKTQAPIVAITGGIATGKSTVTQILQEKGLLTINADELIHEIYRQKETKNYLKELCPLAVNDQDEIDFTTLRAQFFRDHKLKANLENFLYQRMPKLFLSKIPEGTRVVFYDVPLLFEKSLDKLVDMIIVVSANKETQLARLQSRDTESTKETNEKIISQQWPLSKKEDLADFVINNDGTTDDLKRSVERLLNRVLV